MALNRLQLATPRGRRQAIFLGATEPRAARPMKPAARAIAGQGGLAVSISGMRRSRRTRPGAFPLARPNWRCGANVWRGRTSPAGGLKRLRGDQQSAPYVEYSENRRPNDHAIRRAVFAVLEGLAAEHRALTTAHRSVDLPVCVS